MNDLSYPPGPVPLRAPVANGLSLGPWRRAGGVEAQWDTLAGRASSPNPFFERWYLGPALERLDPPGRVSLARFGRAGRLDGLVPLVRPVRYGRHPLPHLASWLHANCFLGLPLIAQGAEHAFWEALLGWADRHAGSALFLHLAGMPLDAAATDALQGVARRQGRRLELVHREERALLAAELSPADYLARALPGKKRKELRRQHARLSELGALSIARSTDAAGIDMWSEAFLALEGRGWKGSAGSALACDPATAGLLRDALAGAAAQGKLERLSLELDGRPIAMLATFLSGSGAFSYKTAFDEDYARFSPGVLLQLENLALLERRGTAWCDSCAAQGHPMIDSLWTERRAIGRFSVAIGGRVRRALFDRLVDHELSRNPTGIA